MTSINLPIIWIPDSDTRVQATCCNFLAIKGNGVNLAKVSGKRPQALALGYTPDFGCGVVATRNDNITMYLEAPYASLMANQDMLAQTFPKVPDA